MCRRNDLGSLGAYLSALLILAGGTVTAAAQTTEQPAPRTPPREQARAAVLHGLEEIVVTAQKRRENLQRVPIAVSVITGKSLTQTGIQTSTTLPQLTPNLSYSANADNVAPYIRGIGTQFATSGLESSVAIYLDDQYIPRADASLFAFSDVARVEVLKGPQGTLYGRNATGGAIRIITNDPVHKFEEGASFTYGSYNRTAVSAYLNLPIGPTLAARFSVDYDNKDGYVHNVNPNLPLLEGRHQVVGHAKFVWDPNVRVHVKLSLDFADKRDTEGQAFISYPTGAPGQIGVALGAAPSTGFYTTTQGEPGNNDSDSQYHTQSGGGALRVDFDAGFAKLSSITGYRSIKFNGPTDADTTSLSLLDVRAITSTYSYSEELQAVSQGSDKLRWTAGFYAYDERSRYDYLIFGAFSGAPVGDYFAGDGRVRVHSYAPYGQLTYQILPKLEVTVGARYTWERKQLVSNILSIGTLTSDNDILSGSGTVVGIIPGNSVRFEQFTPRAVLSYTPVKNVLLYASYSKGFKSGGYSLPAFGAVDKVSPEKLTAFEIGWKTQFGRLRFNGALFHYADNDLQVQYVNAAGSIGVQNAASARLQGAETDIAIAATDNLEVGAGAGLLDTKFNRYIGSEYEPATASAGCAAAPGSAACLGYSVVSANFAGRDLPLSPRFTGHVRAQYTVPLASYGDLAINALLSHTSHYFYDAGQQIRERSREILNGSVGWSSASDKYSVSVFGTNITGIKYTLYKTHFATGGWYIPAPPAEFGVRLGVQF